MEAVKNNKNNGNLIFLGGFLLLLMAIIIGPPISVMMFVVAAIMIFVGGRIKRKAAPPAKPLSQKSAKSKILAGIPAVIMIAASLFTEKLSALLGGLGLMLLAYSIVGLVEVFIDNKFPTAKSSWETMQGWKKLLISIVVIALALMLVFYLMPIVAKLIYGKI
ncbi:hypothetical protein [Thalassolituus oleivorans]|uniref:hypothetical protein n=1 Tax=Thalassolituus oleivorans TaxID=187493 RepID=UPI002409C5A7|nr:hypothetical protein [Thalassolituus oleivorans]MDF1640281.1 hypothetical protein [Thalassolituus oleivorans]